mmetsp:Transcript_34317/g.55226  ORF Transcript_34317/g.55226 Transcript_34317/m.55226 type:complete len:134 (+) Transcript_34317:802-1203(+)
MPLVLVLSEGTVATAGQKQKPRNCYDVVIYDFYQSVSTARMMRGGEGGRGTLTSGINYGFNWSAVFDSPNISFKQNEHKGAHTHTHTHTQGCTCTQKIHIILGATLPVNLRMNVEWPTRVITRSGLFSNQLQN